MALHYMKWTYLSEWALSRHLLAGTGSEPLSILTHHTIIHSFRFAGWLFAHLCTWLFSCYIFASPTCLFDTQAEGKSDLVDGFFPFLFCFFGDVNAIYVSPVYGK